MQLPFIQYVLLYNGYVCVKLNEHWDKMYSDSFFVSPCGLIHIFPDVFSDNQNIVAGNTLHIFIFISPIIYCEMKMH